MENYNIVLPLIIKKSRGGMTKCGLSPLLKHWDETLGIVATNIIVVLIVSTLISLYIKAMVSLIIAAWT